MGVLMSSGLIGATRLDLATRRKLILIWGRGRRLVVDEGLEPPLTELQRIPLCRLS
jgi:hypothetical protein